MPDIKIGDTVWVLIMDSYSARSGTYCGERSSAVYGCSSEPIVMIDGVEVPFERTDVYPDKASAVARLRRLFDIDIVKLEETAKEINAKIELVRGQEADLLALEASLNAENLQQKTSGG